MAINQLVYRTCLLCLLVLKIGYGCANTLPRQVVPLTQATFEHITQAATGQTTGRWFVLFTSPSHENHQTALGIWEELADDEEKDVIYATVNVDAHKQLADRFNMVKPGQAVLFRDRMMYIYEPTIDDLSAIIKFVEERYSLQPPQSVPSVTSAPFTVDLKKFRDTGKLGQAMVACGILAFVVYWKYNTWQSAEQRAAAGSTTASTAKLEQKENKAISKAAQQS